MLFSALPPGMIDWLIDWLIVEAVWPKGKSTDSGALSLTSCVTLSELKFSELQVNEG